MRKYILFLSLFISQMLFADVNVIVSDGIDNATIKSKMERTMSALLTEVNKAQTGYRT